ncbi:LysR family transcriptional regulator [Streptomyces cinerochromogenes]|uniref:LysR family transcriptional regulator n=1 Tax=Streptomyces cinerochromogenes TaxID=66422 RepID=A0ABW7BEK1_9ACTN
MDLDMAQVRAFITTADEQHFGKAAERLHLSQQALSKRIRRLEELLGTRLLERSSQGVELTEAGSRFLGPAVAALDAADTAVAAVAAAGRPLRIDVLDERLVPIHLVQRWIDADPEAPLEVSMRHGLENALPALRRGDIDVAFGRVHALRAPWRDEFAYRPARLEPLVLLVGLDHPFAQKPSVRLAELPGVPLRTPMGGGVLEWTAFLREFADSWSLDLNTSGPALSLDHLVDTVADSPGAATLVGAGMNVPDGQRIRTVPLVDPTPVYPWSAVWRRDRPHRLLSRLLDAAGSGAPVRDMADAIGPVWLPAADRSGLGL